MTLRNFFIFFIFFALNAQSVDSAKDTVVIPIEGEIAPATYTYLERAIKDAQAKNAKQIIFEINTFGGRLDTTYNIVELILSCPIDSVSLVKEKAISAGTLIALASPKLFMMSGATMGDVAPVSMGSDGVTMLGEKFQSPLRAKFRALAEKNNYPVKLSEAFVSSDREIIEVTWADGTKQTLTGIELKDLLPNQKKNIVKRKTLVAAGELLTMNDREAVELGFSSGTVSGVDEIALGKVQRLELKSSEKLLFVLGKYAWLLVLVGLGAIYLEVKNPGFGFFGLLAIIAFSILFTAQHLVKLADYLEFTILLVGFVFLFLEVFIFPGFGVSGLLGILFILSSLVMMFQDFVIPQDAFDVILLKQNFKMILTMFSIATGLFVLSFFLFPSLLSRSPLVFRGVSQAFSGEGEKSDELSDDPANRTDKKDEKNSTALAKSDLRPSGTVVFQGKLYDAISDGFYINRGQKVKVVQKKGSTLIVRSIQLEGQRPLDKTDSGKADDRKTDNL